MVIGPRGRRLSSRMWWIGVASTIIAIGPLASEAAHRTQSKESTVHFVYPSLSALRVRIET